MQTLSASVQGNARAKKWEWVVGEVGGGACGGAVSCETLPGARKHRSGCSQSAIGWITGPPMEELEKIPKELKGSATLLVEQ